MSTQPMEQPFEKPAETGAGRARPFLVTLLTMGVLTLVVLNLTRLLQVIAQWNLLLDIYSLPLTIYLAVSGLVWMVTGVPLLFGLWRGRFWAPAFARAASLLYLTYYWLDRILMNFFAPRMGNWPFLLVVTLVAVSIVFWILSRRNVKAFFGETYDH